VQHVPYRSHDTPIKSFRKSRNHWSLFKDCTKDVIVVVEIFVIGNEYALFVMIQRYVNRNHQAIQHPGSSLKVPLFMLLPNAILCLNADMISRKSIYEHNIMSNAKSNVI